LLFLVIDKSRGATLQDTRIGADLSGRQKDVGRFLLHLGGMNQGEKEGRGGCRAPVEL
jgi:hypothetical protein